MKIGIDGYEANIINRVGIGQYAYQLLKHIYLYDQHNDYTIFLPGKPLYDMPKTRKNWTYCIGHAGSFWTFFQLPKLIKNNYLDLFFSPTHYLPLIDKIPKIMAIMDLSYLHFPKMFNKRDFLKLKYLTLLSIKKAQKVITISEFTKKEIIEHYNFPKNNIFVTYPGKTYYYKPYKSLQYMNLPKKYILFVGTVQPRKNLIKLISAFEKINKDIHLIIVGKKGWLWQESIDKISFSTKKHMIHYLDYIINDDFPYLYSKAMCLVLPSFYEGFGIPVLEAMSFGCPVVISQNTSLPEVAGKKGIYIDPYNIDDIAKGITTAIQLSQDQRKELSINLIKQANTFTWENCAKNTIKVFDDLIKNER